MTDTEVEALIDMLRMKVQRNATGEMVMLTVEETKELLDLIDRLRAARDS